MRTNGILTAISSLPGKQGIGDFGPVAYEFVDLIKEAEIKVWQILPINPLGYGNSPYQSECGEAIDPIYISLELLYKEGYIEEPKTFNVRKTSVDYDAVRIFKDKYLRIAFSNQKDTISKEFLDFKKNNYWLENYAKFHVLFVKNNYLEWYKWDKKERYDAYNHEVDYSELEQEILFIEWCQFIAFKQFKALREYCNKQGIKIMGDIPFYVGPMSSDVWADQDEFLLDEYDVYTHIGGVPPDYFSEDGQRWGNPIYDWEQLKKEKYEFWMNRFNEASKIFDILRIDHFRAFDTYWKIPISCPTARIGEWVIGPRTELFDELFSRKIKLDIVAEDLGDLFPSVLELRDHYNFPGMNVVEFNFLNEKIEPRENEIIYTGTHDNETLNGWILGLNENDLNAVELKMKKLHIKGKNLHDKFLNYAYNSASKYCIIPIQDLLGLDNVSRMNTPGTVGTPNWEFKLSTYTDFKKVIPSIKKRNIESKRI